MKTLYSLIMLSVLSVSMLAQPFATTILKDLKPRNIGPGGMSGRVTAIDVVHSDPDHIYVGTASGGLWESKSGGIHWEPIFEKQVTASIGAVAIQQTNPSIIWVGTGEGNPRNSLNGGFGIFKSLDGGRSWKRMGLEKTRHIHRVIINPTNPDVVYVGAIGSPWGVHSERGVYKTTDGGQHWEKILFVNNKTGVADMVMDPTNPNKLIVAMWEHKRDPWFFKSGGKGSGLYVTFDGGKSWKKRTAKDGIPKGDLGRIGLAIARNKPNIVYALIESKKNALYKSVDGGFSFKKINDKKDIGNRPFYYSDIFVDPQNENRLYSVYTYVNVSEDGGKNFHQLMPAYGVNNGVHPDHHAWWISPNDGSFMIDGNDGGLNITRDGGRTWRFIGNLPVAQFYHIAVDNELPYHVYGGMQDNGSWRGPGYTWRVQGIRNDYWQEISFGDGFDVIPDPDDNRYGWSMSQQGFVSRYDWKTGNNYTVRPTHPDPDVKLRFNWNAAIQIDPFDPSTIYFGSQYVHKSIDKGLTWSIISPDLTTNDTTKQKQHQSGGLTIDATGAENYTTILVIEPSPVEKDMIWVGTDDGKVHYTRDGGQHWTEVSNHIQGMPSGCWITQIKASNKNKGEALLVANDYRRFNYTPYVYRTTDYGKNWHRLVYAKDVKSYALCILEDPAEKNLLFLGTDDGLYFSMDAGVTWQKWKNGFPTVSVKDLVIQPREQDLVIGTFGRAAWVLDDIRPLRAIARQKSILKAPIHIFEPPVAYQAAYQQPTGSRFGADAIFNGQNRKRGAMISYYIKVDPNDKKEKNKVEDSTSGDRKDDQSANKSDSIILKIYDADRLIRTLKRKIPDSTGIYRWYWAMHEAGVSLPNRKIKPGKREPIGVPVRPGTYRIKMIYGQDSSIQSITVKKDPRLNTSEASIEQRYNRLKRIESMTKATGDAVKQLIESKQVALAFQKKLKKEDKKRFKSQIESSKDIIKQIDTLINGFIGKEDKRQGITRDPEVHVLRRIRTAQWYTGSRPNGMTTTEDQLINHAEAHLKTMLSKTNSFFTHTWDRYRQEIEAINIPKFKPTHTIDWPK